MKILYGVQGTGNGHSSRARMMARHFAARGIDVQYLFSGRDRDKFFDMEPFGDYLWRRGLTFSTDSGKVLYTRTVLEAHPIQFIKDVRGLDVSEYDIVLSDYEPVTAWAGKLAGKPVIGLGHQYALRYPDVPRKGGDFIGDMVIRFFAPVSLGIGLHWHHFNAPVIPPMVPPELQAAANTDDVIVVYLPFENQAEVTRQLLKIPETSFIQYSSELENGEQANVSLRKTNHDGFKCDIARCRGVVANAGFMLISECLHMGKPVLCKPVSKQAEQFDNVAALEQLGYGAAMHKLSAERIQEWLRSEPQQVACNYPDVAEQVVEWLLNSDLQDTNSLINQVWRDIELPGQAIRSAA